MNIQESIPNLVTVNFQIEALQYFLLYNLFLLEVLSFTSLHFYRDCFVCLFVQEKLAKENSNSEKRFEAHKFDPSKACQKVQKIFSS